MPCADHRGERVAGYFTALALPCSLVLLYALSRIVLRYPRSSTVVTRRRIRRFDGVLLASGSVGMLKQFINFWQVLHSFGDVYDVTLPDTLNSVLHYTFNWMGQDPFSVIWPGQCISKDKFILYHLRFEVLTPMFIALGVILSAWLHTYVSRRASASRQRSVRSTTKRNMRWHARTLHRASLNALPYILMIIYVRAPLATHNLFQFFDCVHYEDDGLRHMRSTDNLGYGLLCDGEEYDGMFGEMVVYYILWSGTPVVLFAVLLHVVRDAVKKRRPTQLSTATWFLHSEYSIEWAGSFEAVELVRKYALMGFVLLIPSDRPLARLLAGLLISINSLLVSCVLHLYKTRENVVVAIVIQLSLVMLFIAACWAKVSVSERRACAQRLSAQGQS